MTTPRHRPAAGEALRARLRLTEPAVRAATAALWDAPGLAQRYPQYLRVMHGVVRASVPLMERAAARCARLAGAPGPDPVAEPLARYLAGHIEEERGHDDWLADDLASLGHDPREALGRPPPPAVAALVGAQYYWIEHHHPVALLGYIAVLEGNAPAPWLADRVVRDAGVPAAALRTVRAHAALDTGHSDDLHALLDALDLTAGQVHTVTVSALFTVDALLGLFGTLTRTPRPGAPHGPPATAGGTP
ncbi:hypothetical protein GCM10023347_18830 [Streptomyces chumphonensis]|uniref:Iron-containing redox enzyme family protein n=1 Tax=Streptomyces chumphonensis TaxID=1214925 RepID=A0A927F027_9ACTN|nr:iron-containing redox enzyme family protein [Streptomyces chumphonensis]MBD3931789.1 iron-containing redox enzyme family protein [Streptomyces chumphonensis]